MNLRSCLRLLPVLCATAGVFAVTDARADSPVCSGSEVLLSWPSVNRKIGTV